MLGDPSKAKKKLGWVAKIAFEALVKDMVESDLERFRKDRYCRDGGFASPPRIEELGQVH